MKYFDYLRALVALNAAEDERIASLSDEELAKIADDIVIFALPELSDIQLDRIVPRLSDHQLSRTVDFLSDDQLGRIIVSLSDEQLSRGAPDLNNFDIPVVPDIDQKMWFVYKDSPTDFDVGHFISKHRADWYITFAGEAGRALETQFGPFRAATMIYQASTGKPAPDFYWVNDVALADIKARASNT
jgi:hypothetical protein